MKKLLLFISLILTTSILTQAQELKPIGYEQAILKAGQKKIITPRNKAAGDTLYYEDFDSTGNAANAGLPPGWTITSIGPYPWIWSNSAPGGQYSLSVGPLQSTSGANGFLLLPSDLYNTPFPTGGPHAMDSWVTSPAISITPKGSVILQFEQNYRYCCASTDELVAEVSNDNINWTSFDVTLGRGASSVPANPEFLQFDVSSVLGNQNTAYIRFRQTGASHYYFMIDDLALVEGFGNAIRIEDYNVNFVDSFSIKTNYTMFPVNCDMSISVDIQALNHGANTLTGIDGFSRLYLSLIHISEPTRPY